MNGSRNVFVHQLACNMNRKAVPMEAALSFIQTDFNYDEKEVMQAVKSAYGNLHEFAKNEAIQKQKKPTTNTPKKKQPKTMKMTKTSQNEPK